MKHLKILSLLAVAAAAMMAFAASASADQVSTTTGGSAETPAIHAVNEGGHVTLANPIANISCSSTTEGTPNTHGAGENVSGPLSSLLFTGCTNSWHVTASKNAQENYGTLEVESTGGHNGHLYSTGSRVATTRFGITCTYETNGTTIGSVTGGNPATLHIEASIPLVAGASSGLCGSGNAAWEGDYVTTGALYVANS